ncbi:MAG: DUF4340 domain-containing protein [Lachnospiraceae bacterium]|nr:DUF4340 domain-containing protein [Lachnospiraceae bacterium]
MNRFKRIYVLLGVLVVACVATVGVMRYEEHKEQIKNSEEVVLELAKDSVKRLSWEYEEETLSFRKNETWIYEEDEAFPVDEEKINGLLDLFETFGVSFVIEEVEDYSQYGLDDPIGSIRMETEDQSYEIFLGSYSEMDSERYVSIGDGKVYLVKNDPLDQFDVKLPDLIKHDEIPSFEKITEVQFAGAENYSIAYEEDSADTYCVDDVYFTERGGEKKPLDTSLVDGYLDRIGSLGLTNYATYHATEEELASYGLDSPELTVTVDYSHENDEGKETPDTFVLYVSRAPEEKEASAGMEKNSGEDSKEEDLEEEDSKEEEMTAYARIGESQIIYQISGGDYENVMAASYHDLRHQEVLSADFADITQIEISLEGKVYALTSEKKDDEQIWYYQGEEVETSNLKTAFANLKAERFTEESPTQKEEISLTIHLDNKNYPEILVELYRYDGDTCLAMVDGESVSLVKRSVAVDLIEAVHEIVLGREQ